MVSFNPEARQSAAEPLAQKSEYIHRLRNAWCRISLRKIDNDISSSSHLPVSHSLLLPLFCLPPGKRHSLGMSPQILERVVGPRLLIEHMDHYRAVIQQNPPAFVIPFDAHPFVAQL